MLTEIESFRALARHAPDAVSRLPAVLDQIDLIDLGPGIRTLTQTAKPATIRSLDAIHLGTALHSRCGLTSFEQAKQPNGHHELKTFKQTRLRQRRSSHDRVPTGAAVTHRLGRITTTLTVIAVERTPRGALAPPLSSFLQS